MKLKDLLVYDQITIQCHDNPDADAIASGYALYCYFNSKGKDVKLIYSGNNAITKSNLTLMLEQLEIPLAYIPREGVERISGLLITVDCQYGAGNLTRFEADAVAVIDHHPIEVKKNKLVRIQPNLGSCATLLWTMLLEEKYPVNDDINLGTALYYGLFTDTNQFAELFNPVDMDMRENIVKDKRLINRFRNSNLSLDELEIAGIAMLRYDYNKNYRFAVIGVKPCDPNILGLISDFLLQVAEIDTCVVFNEINEGYKLSVRSCIKEVKANELASYVCDKMGSGGGHFEKSGGFISKRLYDKEYPGLHPEAYFSTKITEYYNSFDILNKKNLPINTSDMKKYKRVDKELCYVKMTDIWPKGTMFSLRANNETYEYRCLDDMIFVIERTGEVHYITQDHFDKYLVDVDKKVPSDYSKKMQYDPAVKCMQDSSVFQLMSYAKVCMPSEKFTIFAKPLVKSTKFFPEWDRDRYMLGKIGDYFAVSCDNPFNAFIEPGDRFLEMYEEM